MINTNNTTKVFCKIEVRHTYRKKNKKLEKSKFVIAVCVLFLLINSICVYAQETNPSGQIPTIFVVGDSTASNEQDKGWGSHLGKWGNKRSMGMGRSDCILFRSFKNKC